MLASDGAASDWFGVSVAAAGDLVALGAPRHKTYAGAVYVFRSSDGGVTYGQVAKVAHPAIADGCREEFDSSRFFLEALLATTTYETFLGLMMTEARRVKDKRDSKLDTIDEDEEKGSHK